MATFPFLIVCNTRSLHILSESLIFIRNKLGFLKFPPDEAIRKYPTTYEPIKITGFPYFNRSLPLPYNYNIAF